MSFAAFFLVSVCCHHPIDLVPAFSILLFRDDAHETCARRAQSLAALAVSVLAGTGWQCGVHFPVHEKGGVKNQLFLEREVALHCHHFTQQGLTFAIKTHCNLPQSLQPLIIFLDLLPCPPGSRLLILLL